MPESPAGVADLYIDYKGWRWRPPFHCMRCGVKVDPLQWAFSRSCAGCDVSMSPTARLHVLDYRLFVGPHELIDPNDSHFLNEDRFIPAENAEDYPVLDPPKPLTLQPLQQWSCDQTDALRTLNRVCLCTCLHTVHPVENHSPGCPEYELEETQA
jgi:hypothetical protein